MTFFPKLDVVVDTHSTPEKDVLGFKRDPVRTIAVNEGNNFGGTVLTNMVFLHIWKSTGRQAGENV
jgi:hypothetical protein